MKKLNYKQAWGIRAGLRGYQRRAVKQGIRQRSVALFMDPRLGKSRVDIALTGYWHKKGLLNRWVIVCPNISKYVWAGEISKVLDVPHRVIVLEGGESKSLLTLLKETGDLTIFIINYELTWRIKKQLYKSNPDKVTVDESHRIKRRTSKQSGTVATLGKRAQFRSILTGTPYTSLEDIYSQWKFLDPGELGTWADFTARYVATWGYMGKKPETFHREDELLDRIRPRVFELSRAEAGGFPSTLNQTILFDLTRPASRHYREMAEEFETLVGDETVDASIILTQLIRLQQITGGFLPTSEGVTPLGKDRLSALRELLEEYPPDEPIVIVCKFSYEVECCVSLRPSVKIVGGMSALDKKEAQTAFQEGLVPTCVIQIRAGNVSIDLSRADTLIFFSVSFSHMDYEQARSRIIARTGGHKTFIHMAARNTIDEEILQSLEEDQGIVDRLKFNRT